MLSLLSGCNHESGNNSLPEKSAEVVGRDTLDQYITMYGDRAITYYLSVEALTAKMGKYSEGHLILENVKYLVSKGCDVNAKESNGITPLHNAAFIHNVEISKFLVSQGANHNVKDNDRTTPLDWAKEDGNTEVVKYLSGLEK